jgi:hypothetical protein
MSEITKEFIQRQKDNKKTSNVNNEKIIISPHMDDEIIGCYEVIKNDKPIIIYIGDDNSNERKNESLKLKEEVDIKFQLYLNNIPQHFINKSNTFYFPDPSTEIHPKHRLWGNMGEQLARIGMDVIFYTTNMNTQYIKEEKDPKGKEELLNKIYPSQSNLWKYEKKYILFSGFCKWLF